jgi:hypothetical protein
MAANQVSLGGALIPVITVGIMDAISVEAPGLGADSGLAERAGPA